MFMLSKTALVIFLFVVCRHGYYGSGHQGRSPHHSPRSSSWGEGGHHRHPPLSPSSHDHTLHPPPPPVSHADHTLYPEDEPPSYPSHYEQQSLRLGSRSPGSYPQQPGPSSIGHSDDSEDQRQWGHRMSPSYDGNKQMHMEQQQHEGTKGMFWSIIVSTELRNGCVF